MENRNKRMIIAFLTGMMIGGLSVVGLVVRLAVFGHGMTMRSRATITLQPYQVVEEEEDVVEEEEGEHVMKEGCVGDMMEEI